MTPQRIALFVPNCNAGGTERVCQRMANYLSEQGLSVCVISMADQAFPYPINTQYETLDSKLPSGPGARLWRFVARRQRLLGILKRHNIGTILSMGEYPNVLVASLPKRIRRINRYTNSTVSLAGWRAPLIKAALRWAFGRTDATVVPVLRLASELGLSTVSNKWVEMPNPIDVAAIQNGVQASAMQTPAVQTPPQCAAPFFLHVGQLVPQKDHATLLHAYAHYRSLGGKAKLVMLGQGQSQGDIEALLRSLKLNEHATLQGWVDNPSLYMRHALALVMSSRWEGTPNVMLEALALGCPIISTNCPTGPAEVLCQGEAGRLVQVGDTQALAQEMLRMEREPAWRATWAERATHRAQHYDWARVGPLLLNTLRV